MTHLRKKETHTLKVKEWTKYFMQMERKKSSDILITDKTDFKVKVMVRDKEGHYIMIKRTVQQEDITLVNTYAPNIGAPKYVKQILMDIKRETDRNRVTVRDFNTLLTSMDRSSR